MVMGSWKTAAERRPALLRKASAASTARTVLMTVEVPATYTVRRSESAKSRLPRTSW